MSSSSSSSVNLSDGGAEVVFEFDPGIPKGGDGGGGDDLMDNCSSGEEVTGTEEPQLNLNGYCFLCLRGNCEQSWIEAGGKREEEVDGFNPKSFKTLMGYLTGGEEGGDLEGEDDKGRPLPFCLKCYENLTNLNKLHKQLLEVQRRIQSQVCKLRECVAQTVVQVEGEEEKQRGEEGKPRRNKFLESITGGSSILPDEDTEKVSSWVIRVHDRIIRKVDSPVIFTTEPPPPAMSPQDEEDQVIKVIEVDPNIASQIVDEEEGGSSSTEKQKLQVEFITIEEYTDVQGHVYHVSSQGGGAEARIVEIP